MKKPNTTIFIIAGYHHQSTEPQYQWLVQHCKHQGWNVVLVPITWKRRVMSDYVQEFIELYEKKKTKKNYVLGFSLGAMVAYISAPSTKPDKLYLCSLSPYFKEDKKTWKPWWNKVHGKRRVSDFLKHSASKIAKQITAKTTIFCGTKEGQQYPSLKARCQKAAKQLSYAELVIVPEAPHKIDYPTYVEALQANL